VRAWKLSDVARDTTGVLHGRDALARAVVTDSREAGPGSLFFALRGARVDGRRFVAEAARRGAVGVVVEGRPFEGVPSIVVPDGGRALLALAARHRDRLSATVVGITGSVGKTTTKDFAAAVLAERFRIHSSPASFNNQVGVPLTILGAGPSTEILVCEIGAGEVGEIEALCHVARPGIGIVTTVGLAHLQTFGSRANIRRAKAELIESLPLDGLAVLNADDPVVAGFTRRSRAGALMFGHSERSDVRAAGVTLDLEARPSFELRFGSARRRVRLPVSGAHMVSAALAASACGLAMGLTVEECARGLERAETSPGRMQMFESAGLRVLDDSYNANPESMQAALLAARALAGEGRLVAVLGAMAELGAASRREHEHVGALAARLRVSSLVTVGEGARPIAIGAAAAGLPQRNLRHAHDVEEACDLARATARPGDVVMVKGSRVVALDRVVASLRPQAIIAVAMTETDNSTAPTPRSPR
jgi:UDP-N-acetylmuramoyl-tripeptide--D-alanyl-D-alanine ligase